MDTNQPTPDINDIATALLRGTAPLEVALAAWRQTHKKKLTEVSEHIDRSPGAVSAMLHNPRRCPKVRIAVAELIGYEERPRVKKV